MKFHKKSVEERIAELEEEGIDRGALRELREGCIDEELANRMVENVIGRISLPLGVVRKLRLNGKDYVVPMAIEEPSVIAAANKASKLTLPEGFMGKADESVMIGQIQLAGGKEIDEEGLKALEEEGRKLTAPMEKYGGGFVGVKQKTFSTKRKGYVVVEVLINVADAMGANTVNTVVEKLAPLAERLSGGKARLKIISNLSIYRKAYVKAVWRRETLKADLERKGIDVDEAIEGVIDAYEFAANDPFRLATNNKGIMNGIDAVALATGQDWRAIEAGAHYYSAYKGMKPLATYTLDEEGNIVGEIELPLAVATVGGATKTLSHAKASLRVLGVKSAKELAMIMAAVGLANNFAAIYAMVTEGIQKGHMRLHARNIAIMAGAKGEEIDKVAEVLAKENNYSLEFAKKVLEEMR